jgi:hypothetical protein
MPDIPEDHRFEQFFFDGPTTRRLAAEAMRYRRPLLLCLPSIAEALEAAGHPYRLLDRDTRFQHLAGWQRWDLQKPELVFEDFDAILCDPPFANVTLPELVRAIDLLAAGAARPPAVHLAYIDTREPSLLRAFTHHGLTRRFGPLGYRSVKAETQARIAWYGPAGA